MTDANAPTHGGLRPGAGRKHLDGTPPGNDATDPAERHTVTMPASYWDLIKSEGGTYSAGVRMVVEFWLDSIDKSNHKGGSMYTVLVQHSGDNGNTVSEPYKKQDGFYTVDDAVEWANDNIVPTESGQNHSCWIGIASNTKWHEKPHYVCVQELW